MATSVTVSDSDRATSAATNIRLQYVALNKMGENLSSMMKNPPSGVTNDQLKAALGNDFDVITKALAALT